MASSLDGLLGEDAVVPDAFDFEELAIDLVPEVAQVGQIRRGFGDEEDYRVVDRGLGP
jgi:hypothetical protein